MPKEVQVSELLDKDFATTGLGVSRGPEQSPDGTKGNQNIDPRTKRECQQTDKKEYEKNQTGILELKCTTTEAGNLLEDRNEGM